nr:reverse transcriptase domain-containing protein [Tanacetum cinerariifolium]
MKPTGNPGEANTAPRVNIQELCEDFYEDILPIIMGKARHERLKDVHARLDFEEGPQEGTRENSRYSNTRAKNTEPERAAAQVERWAMPTWCHMFNSTLIEAARVRIVLKSTKTTKKPDNNCTRIEATRKARTRSKFFSNNLKSEAYFYPKSKFRNLSCQKIKTKTFKRQKTKSRDKKCKFAKVTRRTEIASVSKIMVEEGRQKFRD